MDAFDRLHPALQHHIVNSLGWRTLRPLQESAIEPVLAGSHALLVAPTAGGKTEAAVFPLFSRMLSEDWQGLSVLYVCPLRALLNNLEVRLSGYLGLLGRRAGLWHGDVGQGPRRQIQREPPDLLLTTPESLEVMLTSRGIDHAGLFYNLRSVVVDELHAFAGDDRGWHLLSVLERVSRVAGRDLQRIGLSATIGNPPQLLTWLAGSSPGPRTVVAPDSGQTVEADVQIDAVGSLENAAVVLSRLYRGEKRLVFCDSRSRVEDLAFRLRELGVETHVSHGSLGIDERRRAEQAFAEARDCVIVATSTLELGIDVGDLDRVIQIEAPATVASFLQRLGRTGRRQGTKRNMLFLTTAPETLLRAAAIGLLWSEGYVEPVEPPALPFHIYAQQLLALAYQLPGMPRGAWSTWLDPMPGFAVLPAGARRSVVDHLLSEGFLHEDSGLLGFGPESDRRFRGKGFLELLSVFDAAPSVRVLHGRTELGFVDDATFQLETPGGTVLLLGGRSWRVVHVDWSRREAWVEPIEIPGRSLWLGDGLPLGFALCQAQKRVLLGEGHEGLLTLRARQKLHEFRGRFPWLSQEATSLERGAPGRAHWWTFAGLKANATLADHLAGRGVSVLSRDNLSITLGISEGLPPLQELLPVPSEAAQLRPASLVADAMESLKFAFCTPRDLCFTALSRRLADPQGVAATVAVPVVQVQGDESFS
ncbi:MAG TPA: DEAD/DEAH box helicase [Thermoanaerobaculia bacterium]|nr:DEAD/DEAH box helicase [Thermoanaerobaculia bacterium]